MPIPIIDPGWADSQATKPQLQVLEVRSRTNPSVAPICHIVVQRVEQYERDPRDGLVHKAAIELHYRLALPKYERTDQRTGDFTASYRRHFDGTQSVSLTSTTDMPGAVFLDLPGYEGNRIGTYLMNEIVNWARQWPEAIVNSVELASHQGTATNKLRRNRFYEQFGLVFDYSDAEQRGGVSRPMPGAHLRCVDSWRANIREHHVLDLLAATLDENKRHSGTISHQARYIEQMHQLKNAAEKRPIRWLVQVVWERNREKIVLATFAIGIAVLAHW